MSFCPDSGCAHAGKTLEEAQSMCESLPNCSGVIDNGAGIFVVRGGATEPTTTKGSVVYKCNDDHNYKCAKFPLQRGSSDRERCLGGNALQRGDEYVYDHWTCGHCENKCCKRPIKGYEFGWPKLMTILIVQVNNTDIHPNYGSNKYLENQVLHGHR